MGTGLDRVYPARHRELAHQIVSRGGTLATEFPIGTGPRPENFPRRNRIISGLSLGTLVVEAAPRSGSLTTARHALEQAARSSPFRIDPQSFGARLSCPDPPRRQAGRNRCGYPRRTRSAHRNGRRITLPCPPEPGMLSSIKCNFLITWDSILSRSTNWWPAVD